jgi:hypothetical protein
MMVPGLPETISNWPPNCNTRSRIPNPDAELLTLVLFVGYSGRGHAYALIGDRERDFIHDYPSYVLDK